MEKFALICFGILLLAAGAAAAAFAVKKCLKGE